jgi:hypothetical protein
VARPLVGFVLAKWDGPGRSFVAGGHARDFMVKPRAISSAAASADPAAPFHSPFVGRLRVFAFPRLANGRRRKERPMRAFKAAFGLIVTGFIGGFVSSSAHAAPYLPPAGFTRTSESFIGENAFDTGAFAVALDGKVAVATTNFGGGANIKVYANAAAAQASSSPIRTFTDPTYKAWGDLTFADNDTLLFTENGGAPAADAVYRAVVSTGATSNLGNVPNATGVINVGSKLLVTAANNPGTGAVYEINGGAPVAVASNIGVGYLGGIAIDASGNVLVADTNDPSFAGNAGRLLRFTGAYAPLASIDLAGGGGAGAYDVVVDSDGDAFVTTGATLTRVPDANSLAEQFGSAFGSFAFTSSLDFAGTGFEPGVGTGALWVNAVFGDDGRVIGITVPEPASLGLLALASLALVRTRRRYAAGAMASLAAFASVTIATQPARADQFFATQVITRIVGNQQQPGFTDPALALGAPRGGGTTQNSIDAYCLGNGGSLTLGFDDGPTPRGIANAPGFDFIVSENAFLQNEDPARSFAELLFVEVSSDGVHFARMPSRSRTPSAVGAFGVVDPANTKAFAGVTPVLANVDENTIDPFDPAIAGGDAFDLSWVEADPFAISGQLDLDAVRHVRLVDVIGDGGTLDYSGRPVYDPTGTGIGGADIDSVAVINGIIVGSSGISAPEPSSTCGVIAIACIAARRVRHPSLAPVRRGEGGGEG